MDWNNIARFNFTYAIPGGAWLETHPYLTSEGYKPYVNWFSFKEIERHKGFDWIHRHIQKQGMFTGCWVTVD